MAWLIWWIFLAMSMQKVFQFKALQELLWMPLEKCVLFLP